jgi:hypothetical protein
MRTLILIVAIVLFVVPGALAQSPRAGGAKPLDPCKLVTKSEVQEIVGTTVADPALNKTNASVCDFKVGDYGTVGFLVRQLTSVETPDRFMAESKKAGLNPTEAPGFGDRAFFTSPGYGMVQLNTFKGSNYIILTMLVPGAPEANVKTMAGKLMQKVLAKL